MNDKGFSTPFAMIIIFSLSIIVLSAAMLVTACEKKVYSYKNLLLARKEADSIIFKLEKDFQDLKNYTVDTSSNPQILYLVEKYRKYNLSLDDVSTGINRNFTAKTIYGGEGVKEYIASYGEDALSDYGWVNPKYADKEILESIASDFGEENSFPLVNNFPPLNIYFMSDDFLKAVLDFMNIKKSGEKIQKFRELSNDDFEIEDIAKIFELEKTDAIFNLLGTKTVFWKAKFATEKCLAAAVIALVPQKEDTNSADCYRLIEKQISFKGEN